MRPPKLWLCLSLLAAGCGKQAVEFGLPQDYQAPSVDGGSATGSTSASGTAHDGLPCDVTQFLEARCDTCHSNPPVGGAPMPLMTYADLTASSRSDPTKTNAQLSVERMQSSAAPMPPGTHLAASDIAVLQNWVQANAPQGTCSTTSPSATTDGGSTPTPMPPPITGGGTGNSTGNGLPCAVSQFLQAQCQACHSNPPAGGAPMALVTYADLTAPSRSDPTKTNAQLSVERMQSTTSPMPPGTHLSTTDIAVLSDWITSGQPQGSCQTGGTIDAGTSTAGTSGGVPNTPAQCTSGTYYSGGGGSSTMHPGRACIACHSSGEGPSFTAAGTLYPTAHEPNDCNGTASGATIEITDASGRTVTLTPNSAGNFYTSTSLQFPIRAQVTANGQTRAMVSPQMSADCNSCHTQTGASGAPGRVVLP